MTFTSDQCRVLAVFERRTNIECYSCRFEDGGVAFVEASAAKDDEDSGPVKLTIWNNLPFFDERNFILFLNQHKLNA
jgi:hypothetical protein